MKLDLSVMLNDDVPSSATKILVERFGYSVYQRRRVNVSRTQRDFPRAIGSSKDVLDFFLRAQELGLGLLKDMEGETFFYWNAKPSQNVLPKELTHQIPLREGLWVKLTLPVDLTKSEAGRLCALITSIVIPPANKE